MQGGAESQANLLSDNRPDDNVNVKNSAVLRHVISHSGHRRMEALTQDFKHIEAFTVAWVLEQCCKALGLHNARHRRTCQAF